MQITYDIYALLPLLTLIVSLVLMQRVWKYRARPLALTFLVLMAALAWWSLAAFMERSSLELSTKIFWMKMTYPGIAALPVAWLVFTLLYTEGERWLTRRNVIALAIVPVITLVVVWTDNIFHLMWKDIWLNNSIYPPVDNVTHSTWFWVEAVYAYSLILLGNVCLFRLFLRSTGLYRKQVGIMLLATVAPWVANLLFIIGIKQLSGMDPTPLAFAITGIAFFWGLFRLRLLDILPVAHEEILKSMDDGVIVLDNGKRILEINPSAERILGCKRSEAIGKAFGRLLPVQSGLLDLKTEESRTQTEITVGEGQGERCYAVYISAVATRQGLNGYLLLLHDDTQRKKAESEAHERALLAVELVGREKAQEELRKSEEKYSTIVEKGNDGIIIIQDGLVRFANSKMLEFTRFSLESIVGKPFTDFVSPEYRDMVTARYKRRLTGENVSNKYEITILSKDGINVPVEINANRIEYEGKAADMAIVRDITERKRAEEILRASEARFRSLVENAAAGIITTRMDGSILSANRAALELYGFDSQGEIASINARDIYVDAEDRKIVLEALLRRGVVKGLEVRMKRFDRSPFWASINMIILADESGEKQLLSIVQDITERKQAADELQKLNEKLSAFNQELENKVEDRTRQLEQALTEAQASNHAKSEFLASMSHELRTPLNAIIGFSQVLQAEYFGGLNAKQSEYITDILDSGKHLLSLINDVLDISKVEAGKMELEISRVKIKDLLNGSLTMIKEKAQAHRIGLEMNLTQDIDDLEIEADERRLKQVVFNLLSNAAKFTPDGGRIVVSAEKENSGLVVSVTDTGIGISPEEQKKLFQPFYQARGGMKDKTPGTGLGLSITRSIIEKHGGRIWMESEGPGKGSRFIFSLPVQHAAEVRSPVPAGIYPLPESYQVM
jgi:PAS domain S-box-containing protein